MPTPVAERIFTEPWAFEFFQAVRLLELLNPGTVPVGEGSDPAKEAVRLRSLITFVFPPNEVAEIAHAQEIDDPILLTANLLAVAGANGPLPDIDSERVVERTFRKDYSLRDFLDIFHHRLLSILVRIQKAHHPAYTPAAPHKGLAAQFLYAVMGLSHDQLRDRLLTSDRSLLYYTGLLGRHPRSASGLEQFLSDYFQIPVRVHQLIGGWRRLDSGEWTAIGRRGRNQELGAGALLGNRVWDQQSRFEVELGPMQIERFFDFLPKRSGYQPLCELTRFYAGPDLEFSFRLVVSGEQVPRARLGQAWLGWTSYLRKPHTSMPPLRLRLVSRRPADPFAEHHVNDVLKY